MREDARFRVLRLIEESPEMSQRQIADELGISLGSVNYCLKGLVEKGMTKAGTDSTLTGFLRNIVYIGLLTFVILAAIAGVLAEAGHPQGERLLREAAAYREDIRRAAREAVGSDA